MKPSILVTRRNRSSRLVQKAFSVDGPRAANELTRRLARYAEEGEAVPDVGLLMTLFERWLRDSTEGLVAADLSHEEELTRGRQFRAQRDRATAELIEGLIALRDGCVAFYGASQLETVGFSEQTPRDPLVVLTTAQRLAEILRSPEQRLVTPRFANLTFEPADLAANLDPLIERLENAMDRVDQEVKKSQSTQAVKNERSETYDHAFFYIARWLEASFALAGMLHQSKRVRPSTRRRGRTDVEPAPDETKVDSDPSEGTADPADPADSQGGDVAPANPADPADDPLPAGEGEP